MPPRTVSAPIAVPPPESCTLPTRQPPPAAGTSEREALDSILAHFSNDELKLRIAEDEVELRELDEIERMFLSEEMMLRYIHATRGKVKAAIERLEATIVWRRSMGLWDIEEAGKEVAPEFESGKVTFIGYTRLAQPVLYTWTSKNKMPASPRQVKHMMFCMDRLIDLQLAGVPGVMFCADVSGKTQTQSGAMGVARQILRNLQAHYPERLGNAALLKMPWLGSLFVSLMWPFVESDTSRKIHVNPQLSNDLIAHDQLLEEYGGEVQHEWDQSYLDSLIQLCVARREANLQRWRAAGAKVGISEWDFFEPHPNASKTMDSGASPTVPKASDEMAPNPVDEKASQVAVTDPKLSSALLTA